MFYESETYDPEAGESVHVCTIPGDWDAYRTISQTIIDHGEPQ